MGLLFAGSRETCLLPAKKVPELPARMPRLAPADRLCALLILPEINFCVLTIR